MVVLYIILVDLAMQYGKILNAGNTKHFSKGSNKYTPGIHQPFNPAILNGS